MDQDTLTHASQVLFSTLLERYATRNCEYVLNERRTATISDSVGIVAEARDSPSFGIDTLPHDQWQIQCTLI